MRRLAIQKIHITASFDLSRNTLFKFSTKSVKTRPVNVVTTFYFYLIEL